MSYFSNEDKLTIEEAAKLMGRHPRTIRRWISKGLRAYKVGRVWMTTPTALEHFIEEQTRRSLENKDVQGRKE